MFPWGMGRGGPSVSPTTHRLNVSIQLREDKWGATWKKSSGPGLENWH
jgi:hypothetical protein